MKGQHIMNKELIKLDNNTGIVSNELGTINIIKTNNQEFSLEQILKTENTLEESSIYLNFLKKNLSKKYSPAKYIITMILTLLASVLISLVITLNPLTLTFNIAIASKILLGLAPSLLITKSYLFKRDKRNLELQIKNQTKEIRNLETALYNMKKLTSYQVIEENVQNTPNISHNNQVNLHPEKVHKLVLALKK